MIEHTRAALDEVVDNLAPMRIRRVPQIFEIRDPASPQNEVVRGRSSSAVPTGEYEGGT